MGFKTRILLCSVLLAFSTPSCGLFGSNPAEIARKAERAVTRQDCLNAAERKADAEVDEFCIEKGVTYEECEEAPRIKADLERKQRECSTRKP